MKKQALYQPKLLKLNFNMGTQSMTKTTVIQLDPEYKALIRSLKERVIPARLRASLAVNYEQIKLYWEIGRMIIERQKVAKWGSKLLEQISRDLCNDFPDIKGFSKTNLKYMRMFAEQYPELVIGQQSVDQICQLPWGHISVLLQRVKNDTGRDWYATQTEENGWSRNVLSLHIKQNLYQLEIDFVAEKNNQIIYIQVACLLHSQDVIDREYGNLEKIKDSWPKWVVTLDEVSFPAKAGILHVPAWELLEKLVYRGLRNAKPKCQIMPDKKPYWSQLFYFNAIAQVLKIEFEGIMAWLSYTCWFSDWLVDLFYFVVAL